MANTTAADAVGPKALSGLILLVATSGLVFASTVILRRVTSAAARRWRPLLGRGVSALNCAAGGVFLGTALLHILVEAQEATEAALKTEFPAANAFVLAGLVLIMCVEEAASFLHSGVGYDPRDGGGEAVPMLAGTGDVTSSGTGGLNSPHDRSQAPLDSVLLTAAISIHAVFEGLALGLQNTPSAVYNLLFAIGLHKIVVTVSVGVTLGQAKSRPCIPFLLCVLYSLAAPLGVLIGALVAQSAGDSSLTAAVLQSLSCGTFIYVAAFEILPHELHRPDRSRALCLISFVTGLGIITALTVASPHEHDHHSHHGGQHLPLAATVVG